MLSSLLLIIFLLLFESLQGVFVFILSLISKFSGLFLNGLDDLLSVESGGSDESLDLRSLEVGFTILGLDFSLGEESSDHQGKSLSLFLVLLLFVVDFEETEFLKDLGGSLGSSELRDFRSGLVKS